MLVADDGVEETGVEAMVTSAEYGEEGRKSENSRRADKLRFVGHMLILTCRHVLHNNKGSIPQYPLLQTAQQPERYHPQYTITSSA